ncbi:COQ9 family protein [Jannaschia seohaensis]|uniref:Ubiquinone biosynthesis protein COQ9 n=1 Tax=Jannaschia seohaensis TaxID=475081 RepID=A0A2Y9AQR6_9RHOB|nr:COQ9 family protein [Jannaschia seohaensis]PWJ18219.1 ubiquinone biosynthesis protein COQ9 [Jannaschia seohaensis]SSA46744.1 ubiquinone biosynthesis protein COQ9 [Jannaschia seohaensis]
MTDLKNRLIDAALMHVPFDGWSETAFRAAIADTGIPPAEARAAFPRGAVDLALAFHRRDDARMGEQLGAEDLAGLRYRDRVAHAVRTRIVLADENREAVRRGMTLFALPIHAADGTRALWGTADAIWTILGDTSEDVNWYSKRAILSGVYSSTVLYWLGDQSEEHRETWAFLDRRIEDVMRFEKVKARINKSPVLSRLMAGPNMVLSRIRKPSGPPIDLPGYWGPRG